MHERDGTTAIGRVLVVDDDPGMRNMLSVALRRHGFVTDTAADGLEALALLSEQRFDAVLTDLQMPRLDGLSLMRKIHAADSAIPVLIQTTRVDRTLETVLGSAGAYEVFMKGGPLDALLLSVEAACQTRRLRSYPA
jgi:DNA-binding response OmpR family regulator